MNSILSKGVMLLMKSPRTLAGKVSLFFSRKPSAGIVPREKGSGAHKLAVKAISTACQEQLLIRMHSGPKVNSVSAHISPSDALEGH